MVAAYENFNVEQIDDVTVVRLDGQRIASRVMMDELWNDFLKLLEELQPSRLLVSCSGVRYLTSQCINALVRVQHETRKNDGQVKLCELQPQVRQTFKVLNLCGRVFTVYENEADAMNDFIR